LVEMHKEAAAFFRRQIKHSGRNCARAFATGVWTMTPSSVRHRLRAVRRRPAPAAFRTKYPEKLLEVSG
jgi:hypothetical protein